MITHLAHLHPNPPGSMGLLKGEYCPRNTEAITSLWKVTTGAGAKVGDVRGVWGDRKIQQ